MPRLDQLSLAGFGPKKTVIQILSDEELWKLLGNARHGDFRDFMMLELVLFTGLRCAELVGLDIENICPDEQVLRCFTLPAKIAKGGKARDIVLNPQVRDDLDEYLGHRAKLGWPSDDWCPLFISKKTGRRLSTRDFQRITRKLGFACIGRAVNPHLLRHTFATRLLNASNLRIVQLALGHESITSTQIYVHPNSAEIANAVDALSAPEAPQLEGGRDVR